MKPPSRGDILIADLNPTKGHEQSGRRPVLVVSHTNYNKETGMLVICPITSNVRGSAFEFPFKTKKTQGAVLCNQVRTLDPKDRKCRIVDHLEEKHVSEAVHKIKLIID